ncbi:MAG: hypothetical protein ACREVX_02030 [Clostridium sp.]|uniref:hypothetical protein n=1 Tax=Clostridium sp. TaxID=1506 RepID=UPI003D6CA02D
MPDYILFCILIFTTFLIISFPIILDIINMRKTHEIRDTKGLTRRSITLSLVFIYICLQIYFIVFNKTNNISEEFKTILISVIAYYFGKSTALDDPNKQGK